MLLVFIKLMVSVEFSGVLLQKTLSASSSNKSQKSVMLAPNSAGRRIGRMVTVESTTWLTVVRAQKAVETKRQCCIFGVRCLSGF